MDRATLTLRPATPADLPALEAFVQGLSVLARAQRFFGPVASLPSLLADALRRDDPLHRFVVVDTPTGEIAGFAEYAIDPAAPDGCNVAVAVADAWQRRGLGLALLRQVIADAERRGLATAVGEVLRYNRAMLALARRAGFEIGPYPGDATLVRITRPLRPGDPDPAPAGLEPVNPSNVPAAPLKKGAGKAPVPVDSSAIDRVRQRRMRPFSAAPLRAGALEPPGRRCAACQGV